MKNKAPVTAGMRVAIASSILAFACASASAAELTATNNLAAEFQTVAHSDLLMLGPVDAVDQAKSRAQVLGQWVQLSPGQATQELVGRVLAVYGFVSPDGSLEVAATREQNSVEYVPGATRVYLKGTLTEIDSLHGAARIGSISISYSNALHTLAAEDLAVGSVVSFAGLRYTDGNKMYADSGLVHRAAGAVQTLGQTGSGSKTLGQTGSGMNVLGQTGSGFHTLGQTGSGFQTLGQTGSGMHVLGQTGSGFQTRGQTGSGMNVLGQTGSGFHTLGQTGSGFHTLGHR